MPTASLVFPGLESPEWHTRAPVPTPRSEVAVAELDGFMFVIGGFGPDRSPSTAVEVYNPATETWSAAAPLPQPRHHAAAVSLDGKLYVFGGYSASFRAPTSTVFVYDRTTDAWTELEGMPRIRGAHAAAVLDRRIYLVGGATTGPNDAPENVAEVDVFDPVTNQWTEAAPLQTPRDHLGVAVVERRIYAIGGREQLDYGRNLPTNEAYNPGEDVWTLETPLPTARSGLAVAASVDGFIYAVGGEGPDGTFDEVEVFSPTSGTWNESAPLTTPRHGMGAAVLSNQLFIPAGGPTTGFSVTAANEALGPLVSY